MIEKITLITKTETRDTYGDPVVTTTERTVLAEYNSISQKEFYQAQAVGLQPQLRFTLRDYYDYNGEEHVRFQEEEYKILRTYRNGNALELTVTREVNDA